jgi:PhnB protein
MKAVNPYLYFPGCTEEAFRFYRSVFGGDFAAVIRFRDFPDNPMGVPEAQLDKIAHIALPFGQDNMLMGTDYLAEICMEQPAFVRGNNFSITLGPESAEEAETLYNALSVGGKALMPLQRTEWAEKHGSCEDRFGVQWMLDYTGEVKFPF